MQSFAAQTLQVKARLEANPHSANCLSNKAKAEDGALQQGAAWLLVSSLPSQVPGSRCHLLQRENMPELLTTSCSHSLPLQWNLPPQDLAALEGNLPVFIAIAVVELPSRF